MLISLLGVVILAAVFVDFIGTTVGIRGGGPITWPVSRLVWRGVVTIVRRTRGHAASAIAGPAILCFIAAIWIVSTWIGWTLVLAGVDGALQAEAPNTEATLVGELAFVGSTLSTVGSSLLTPANQWIDLLTVFIGINGMVALTLSVSFILSLSETVLSGRAFALRVASFEDARHADLADLYPAFSRLCVALKAYPMALFFVPRDSDASIPISFLRFAELASRLEGAQQARAGRTQTLGFGRLPAFEADDASDRQQAALRIWVDRFAVHRDKNQHLTTAG